MIILEGKGYRSVPSEEIAQMAAEAGRLALVERSRPLTVEEVQQMLLEQQINTLEVDDNTALRMAEFYPQWSHREYGAGFKVRRVGRLWRCLQSHTGQVGWEPDNTPALWEEICESHAGTKEDPIPYSGNMALVSGLHYMEDYTVYRCTRDTINPVYNALGALVGLYVEVVL